MVNFGIVAITRIGYQVYGFAEVSILPVLTVIGAISALLGAILALAQDDLKRLLAYRERPAQRRQLRRRGPPAAGGHRLRCCRRWLSVPAAQRQPYLVAAVRAHRQLQVPALVVPALAAAQGHPGAEQPAASTPAPAGSLSTTPSHSASSS